MLENDEGPKEWELKDEVPPETLKQKWEQEEAAGPERVVCPSCQKETPAGNLTCLFCGSSLSSGSCPIGCLLLWVKRLFKKG